MCDIKVICVGSFSIEAIYFAFVWSDRRIKYPKIIRRWNVHDKAQNRK